MRILILGVGGMLGHKLWQCLRDRFKTWATARAGFREYERYGIFDPDRFIPGVDATDFDSIVRVVGRTRPDVVVNCIGIVKQLATAKDPIVSLSINSIFPHRLADLCKASGSRLIHISTDCVFSGRKGMYVEGDEPDAVDLYGRSKSLGEVDRIGCLTIRTSIIGRELATASGLVEWFLARREGTASGYCHAIYTGFTTQALAGLLAEIVADRPELHGVWHVSSEPISKFDLLGLIREAYGLDIEICPDLDFRCDRSLDSTRFRAATGFRPPTWPDMIREMSQDLTPYERWRVR